MLLFWFLPIYSIGQIQNPVHWKFSAVKTGPGEGEIILSAKIDTPWHIYSQFIQDGGPIPTTIVIEKSPDFKLIGKVKEEGNLIAKHDKAFDMELKYFDHAVAFRQKIKIISEGDLKIKGTVDFMVCNEEMCLPPTTEEFDLLIGQDGKTGNQKAEPLPDSLPQVLDTIQREESISDTVAKIGPSGLESGCGDGEVEEADVSLLGILLGGMAGGLLALLTPCVFPMIPLTVSFFTKRSGSRRKGVINAFIYAASIILIYVSLGLLITVTLGSDALNDMASSVFFNMLFFIIFIIFAISFFGAFEITLPASWVNKADSASDKGGLIGIFFMAFTLSLVSFSCTGPIIGTLLVEAAHGRSYMGPLLGMFGFSFALALPFALFAMFPGWLQSLPKSGGWLNTVKVCLGFLELALALKFFSNVDLAYHWGLLKREMFIALWVVIFGVMGLYLLGKIRLSKDGPDEGISTPRLLFALITLTFTIYLIPGIWGAPLKLISGFPPPDFYKEWTTGKSEHCPHDLNCFHDYNEGLAYAREQGKPLMIDFTGWSCVNCRKMEDNVWSDPEVLKKLRDDFVLVSLYVDDKTPLAEKDQRVSTFSGKKIKTEGNKWSDLQATVYQTNSQPYYVLLDHHEKVLAIPRGYTPDIKEYTAYLEEGLCRFRKRMK